MSKNVEFFFDFGSPASYLAWTQLPQLCDEAGARLIYKPMLLWAVFQATGNHSPVMVAAKGRFMFQDFARFARRYQVPMLINPFFPINTLTIMRGVLVVQQHMPARFEDYMQAIFNAMWVKGLNLGDSEVLAQVLSEAGFDPQQMLALTQEQAVKDQLKANTEEAVARGVFGAPSMFVGDELFFGQDRLDFVREALA